MRRSLILTILAITLLFAVAAFWLEYSPASWQYNVQHVIAVPLLIALVWFFTRWYKRYKDRKSKKKEEKDSYLLLILGLIIFAISIGSLIIVPVVWPTIGPTESVVWISTLMVGAIVGLFFIALWMVSRQ